MRRRKLDRQIDDELATYVAERTARLVAGGVPPDEAERRARAELGSLEATKDEMRDAHVVSSWLDGLVKDARLATRRLARQPGFTLIAILTLALGIGGTSAIFSVVKAVLLDPLPYSDPGRLVNVWNELRAENLQRMPGSATVLRELRARTRRLESVGAIWAGSGTLRGDGDPEQLKVGFVTGELFDVLGAKPLLGRAIAKADECCGRPPVIVLTYGTWQRRFGGDPSIIGRAVRFEETSATIVGVMPADFRVAFPPGTGIPPDLQAFAPFLRDVYAGRIDWYYLRFVGRLAPGVTVGMANDELEAIGRALRGAYAELDRDGVGLDAAPMHAEATRSARPALLALLGGIGLVLLIACANVANLLLARSAARRHEMAVRAALGASRGRLVRQLLTESLALAGAGGLVGLALGALAVEQVAALAPPGVLPPGGPPLDLGVLAFTALASCLSGLLFGIAPALDGARVDLAGAMQAAGRGMSPATGRRARRALVAAEMAVGFVLLVGAGLMIRTFVAVQRVDPGFDADGALTFELALPASRYGDEAKRAAFARELERRLAALPGVTGGGAASHLPLDGAANWSSPYGAPGTPEEKKKRADHRAVTAGYLPAIHARLVRGRLLEDADRAAIVIDERLAAEAFAGEDPIGRPIEHHHLGGGDYVETVSYVVGVIKPIAQQSLTSGERGQIYMLHAASPRERLVYVVRGPVDAATVRGVVASLDGELAVARVQPFADYLERAQRPARFTMVLASIFGGLALVLAAIGTYGVVSAQVSQRRRELGVRLALGAGPGDIVRLVLGEGVAMALAGLAVGGVATLALARLLGGLLFGVSPLDPATLAGAAVVLPASAILACWLPARRAARASPMAALRVE